MGVIRRLPLEATVDVLLPAAVVMFAFGSSSVDALRGVGGTGRWIVLLALAAVAVLLFAARGRRPRTLPVAWLAAAALLVVGLESALWSVDPRLTVERIFTVGVVFVAAVALALGARDPGAAVTRVLRGVLVGTAAVAVISLVVLALARDDAVLSATAGAGWRLRGVGENPNTVPMLLAIGLPLAVWWMLEHSRWTGGALVLLFAGEIACSDSRGATVAAFGGAIVTALVLGRSRRTRAALAVGLCVLAVACLQVGKLPDPATAAEDAAPSQRAAAPARGIDAEQEFRLEDEIGFPAGGAYRPPVRRTVFGPSERAQAWEGAIDQGAERPIAGYGFGTEDGVFVDRFYSFEAAFVENAYLGLLMQVGAAGLALFVVLLVALAWTALRLCRGAPRAELGPAAAAAGVLLAAILIGGTQSGLLAVGNVAAASIWLCVLQLPALGRASVS